jgi:MFS family permease
MGLIGAAFGIGFVLGPAIGGFLGKAGGNLYIGLFCAGLSAINLVSALLRLPESLDKSHPSHKEKKAALSLPERMKLPGVGILFGLTLLVTTAFAQVEGTFSMYLLVRFLSPDAHVELSLFDLNAKVPQKVLEGASLQVGWLFTAIGVIGAVIQGGLIGRLKKKFGEPNLIRIGLLCWGVGVALLPLMPSYGWMFAPTVVMAMGSALTNPSLSSLVSLRAPRGRSGEILGTFQSFSAMGRILGPSLGGFWFATFSSGTPFYVGGALLLVGAMIAMMIGSVTHAPEQVIEA